MWRASRDVRNGRFPGFALMTVGAALAGRAIHSGVKAASRGSAADEASALALAVFLYGVGPGVVVMLVAATFGYALWYSTAHFLVPLALPLSLLLGWRVYGRSSG
ncbi:hypothetical protein DLJ49_15345 [Rhodovulum sp. 12E13]|uniref:hypothetical protein n=1 Tax=Rhodovulum sp. 12E13 TaxID=2203891 RepID=UPI000E15540E|nr:hypothetical protein [Rhodovulum sp. 12E13]RDC71209.1 hypothetical protein DLJ49_15345 [Rhodovulum sp. 12E13]